MFSTAQKVLYGSDRNLHGARLDVYTEPEVEDYGEERAAVYDIEPDRNDGAGTLFLYTKGTVGIPGEAVRQLLHYMEDTTYENAVNEELREIHRMVETVKNDQEVGGMRIKIIEENYELKREVTRQAEENTKQANEITKLTEEIIRLREELNRRNEMEKA